MTDTASEGSEAAVPEQPPEERFKDIADQIEQATGRDPAALDPDEIPDE